MSKNKTLFDFFGKKTPNSNKSTPEANAKGKKSPDSVSTPSRISKTSEQKKKSPDAAFRSSKSAVLTTPAKGSITNGVTPKRLSSCLGENSNSSHSEDEYGSKKSKSLPKSSKRRRIVVASESEGSEDEYKPGKDEMSSESDSDMEEEASPSESEPEEEDEPTPKKRKTAKGRNKMTTPLPPSKAKRALEVSKDTKMKLASFSPSQNSSSDFSGETSNKEWTHLKYDWLKEEQRRDKKGRSMSHPDYDPRTLYVPENFKKNCTPAMKQWWDMKLDNFDTVLFFKVGKFYELYHMDAVTGVNELGLIFMKGEFAHSGFPEIAYGRYSDVLVQKGYKVARVEQTETPQMMEERCRQIVKPTKFDKVVNREICQITTKGTRTFTCQDGEALAADNNYLLAITEKVLSESAGDESEYGVCFIDTSVGKFFVGQFTDDRHCSRLRTLIVHYAPSEVLYERDAVSKKTHQVFNSALTAVNKEALHSGTHFWEPSKVLKYLADGKYFTSGEGIDEWSSTLQEMLDSDDRLHQTPKKEYELAIRSLGACIWYLKKCLIDDQLLTMKLFEQYVPIDGASFTEPKKTFARQHMILDGITLRNLEILETNSSETIEGSLQEAMDFCCTSFGKRLFRQWLCSPLCHAQSISDRLDAVDDLEKIPSAVDEVLKYLKKLPDLERLLSKIHAQGLARPSDHPDNRAIFYEEVTYSKKKIMDFLSTLDGFKSSMKIISAFKPYVEDFRSALLTKCVSLVSEGGHFPELLESIEFFDNAFDHDKARKDGKIIPSKGVDKEFDSSAEELQETQEDLDAYLEKQKKYFQCKVTYIGTGKNRFQLEVPEHAANKASDKYEIQSQRKGFKRFYTSDIKQMLARYIAAEEQRDAALLDIMRRIFASFDEKYKLWKDAVQCLSVLDVLLSFLQYKKSCQVATCRPEIVVPDENMGPFIDIKGGRHPSLLKYFIGDSYIPNDIYLGHKQNQDGCDDSKSGSMVLVTGPNMGGKSTLMRQTGLLVIMAQMGSYIPAESCCLTPVDRIFTRLGASDRITAGESTFFVEVSETSCILQHATQDSLVLVDELGRGTSTYDGTAIACAVVRALATQIKCRTLFSTHYHCLVDEFIDCLEVSLGHMACIVEEDDKHPALESITFLYKFMEGVCPKSYGFNAAHLAGIPDTVIQQAYHRAQEFERTIESKKIFRLLNACQDIKELKRLQDLCSVLCN